MWQFISLHPYIQSFICLSEVSCREFNGIFSLLILSFKVCNQKTQFMGHISQLARGEWRSLGKMIHNKFSSTSLTHFSYIFEKHTFRSFHFFFKLFIENCSVDATGLLKTWLLYAQRIHTSHNHQQNGVML